MELKESSIVKLKNIMKSTVARVFNPQLQQLIIFVKKKITILFCIYIISHATQYLSSLQVSCFMPKLWPSSCENVDDIDKTVIFSVEPFASVMPTA